MSRPFLIPVYERPWWRRVIHSPVFMLVAGLVVGVVVGHSL